MRSRPIPRGRSVSRTRLQTAHLVVSPAVNVPPLDHMRRDDGGPQ